MPVSGDNNVVLYLEGYGSFADLEKAQSEFEATLAMNALAAGRAGPEHARRAPTCTPARRRPSRSTAPT